MDRDILMAAAREAAQHAYVPYSHFRVGAAVSVATPSGEQIVTGANVENASYGLTLCAERAALAAARMVRPTGNESVPITAIAVACVDVADDAPAWRRSPCGACRQWFAELAPDAAYYIDGIPGELHLPDLLPYAFRLDDSQ
jgi:cytidine deaminase